MRPTDWDPVLYNRFQQARFRPLEDLVALLPPRIDGRLLDLGCGDGHNTAYAAEQLGITDVVGVDSSPAMIERASERPGQWRLGDLSDVLDEPETFDVVMSNAAIHWLPDHAGLLPRILCKVAPGGWLAIQMPVNNVQPSHTCMAEAAGFAHPWPQRDRAFYDAALAGLTHRVVEERSYRQPMPSVDAIVQMLTSTGARPYLQAVDDPDAFVAAWRACLDRCYPPCDDADTRLFDFHRILMVGRRSNG